MTRFPFVYCAWIGNAIILILCIYAVRGGLLELDSERENLVSGEKFLVKQLGHLEMQAKSQNLNSVDFLLKPTKSLSEIVSDIDSLSKPGGVVIESVSLKTVEEAPAKGRQMVEINMRLSGGYVPIKEFIGKLLASQSGLSLNAFNISRANSKDSVIQGEIRWTLFFRSIA